MNSNMKIKNFSILSYLLLVAFLHVNAILKYEDPIADAQTEGILYDQKMEQEKDGVKAAATPRVVYYGGQGFLTKSSLAKHEKEVSSAKTGKKKDSFNWSDWWEEKPTDDAGAKLEEPILDEGPSPDAEITAVVEPETPPPIVSEAPKVQPKSNQQEETFFGDKTLPESDPASSQALSEPLVEPAQGNSKGDDWW